MQGYKADRNDGGDDDSSWVIASDFQSTLATCNLRIEETIHAEFVTCFDSIRVDFSFTERSANQGLVVLKWGFGELGWNSNPTDDTFTKPSTLSPTAYTNNVNHGNIKIFNTCDISSVSGSVVSVAGGNFSDYLFIADAGIKIPPTNDLSVHIVLSDNEDITLYNNVRIIMIEQKKFLLNVMHRKY